MDDVRLGVFCSVTSDQFVEKGHFLKTLPTLTPVSKKMLNTTYTGVISFAVVFLLVGGSSKSDQENENYKLAEKTETGRHPQLADYQTPAIVSGTQGLEYGGGKISYARNNPVLQVFDSIGEGVVRLLHGLLPINWPVNILAFLIMMGAFALGLVFLGMARNSISAGVSGIFFLIVGLSLAVRLFLILSSLPD